MKYEKQDPNKSRYGKKGPEYRTITFLVKSKHVPYEADGRLPKRNLKEIRALRKKANVKATVEVVMRRGVPVHLHPVFYKSCFAGRKWGRKRRKEKLLKIPSLKQAT